MAMMLMMRQTKKYRGLEGLGVGLLSIASFLYTIFSLMYLGIYPTLPVRSSLGIYPTRELHGYYLDIYPPNTDIL
jgi:hypothetical protein